MLKNEWRLRKGSRKSEERERKRKEEKGGKERRSVVEEERWREGRVSGEENKKIRLKRE